MIAYTVPIIPPAKDFHEALLAAIAEYDQSQSRTKSWPLRAAAALKKFKANPDGQPAALWGEIKPVYLRIQGGTGKCAFCERLLGADEIAAYESDVEHFRPKKGVTPWPPAEPLGKEPYPADLPASKGTGKGYRNLPYHELNYIVACKTCNTRCKANYFPIEGKHSFTTKAPGRTLDTKEKPFLIYPLGGLDADPESLITFVGCKAMPAKPPGKVHDWNRARVTIAFFLLNDPSREDQLILERASRLDLVGHKIEDFERSSAAQRQQAWDAVKAEGHASLPHASCVRAMIRLYASDPDAARKLIADARVYRKSKLPLDDWAAGLKPPI